MGMTHCIPVAFLKNKTFGRENEPDEKPQPPKAVFVRSHFPKSYRFSWSTKLYIENNETLLNDSHLSEVKTS